LLLTLKESPYQGEEAKKTFGLFFFAAAYQMTTMENSK
jgi:hypothetical protein